jgi:hypothetical protein
MLKYILTLQAIESHLDINDDVKILELKGDIQSLSVEVDTLNRHLDKVIVKFTWLV